MLNLNKMSLTTKLCSVLIVLVLVVLYKEKCKKEYMNHSETGTSTIDNLKIDFKNRSLKFLENLKENLKKF
tara:strand:- start:1717 stop:1929 length:213 start_codon:yes stop_codon:yes gene_type:complete